MAERASGASHETKAPEPPADDVWTLREAAAPPPLTHIAIDDATVAYETVETELTTLFSIPEGDLSGAAMLYLVGGNLAVWNQQIDVIVFDLAGGELARVPCKGVSAYFSENYFAVADFGRGYLTVYDSEGGEIASLSLEAFPGTVQSFAVTADGGRAFAVADNSMGGYSAYSISLPDGAPVPLDAASLSEGVSLAYILEGIRGGYAVFNAYRGRDGQYTDAVACYDIAQEVFADVFGLPQSVVEDDMIIMGSVRISRSGLLYEIADVNRMRMGPLSPFPTYGDELDFIDPFYGVRSRFAQFYPLSGQGRVGYFNLYDYTAVGMDSPDSAILCAFDRGENRIVRVALGERIVDPPAAGINLSVETLDAFLGQRLRHRSYGEDNTYGLVSAMVTTYTDQFAEIGYIISEETPELADRLVWYILSNYYHSCRDRREPYYDTGAGEYVIPLEVIEGWVADAFPLIGFPVDLTRASGYDSGRKSFIIPMGGGMGENDTVYLEDAAVRDDAFVLDVVVLPSSYRMAAGADKTERLRMTVRYNEAEKTWRYENVEVSAGQGEPK